MIRSAEFSEDADVDLLPVAVVRQSLESVIGSRASIRRAFDDLDWFSGVDFLLDDKVRFAFRRYDGHPVDTFTIYVDRSAGIEPSTMALILGEFRLPTAALVWENDAIARAYKPGMKAASASAGLR